MAFHHKALFIGLIGVVMAIAAPVSALDLTNVAFVQTSEETTSIPIGHLEFCQARPSECGAHPVVVPAMALTEATWQQLVAVNSHYNETIVPVTDEDLYRVGEFWTYPNGYGDCEDYALIKRRELINAGWPASTLMLTVARNPDGTGHAVLIARTDRGDFVLDNQDGAIRLWSETPYQFVKRQSQAHAGQWVDMLDNRAVVLTTASH